jgi:hypothetical protein
MKKLIIISLISFFAISLHAQSTSPWSGFWTPVKKVYPKVEQNKLLKSTFDAQISKDSTVWLFRPIANVSALAITFQNGSPVNNSFTAIGSGISYAKFIPVNGQPYAQFSVNALLLTNYSINGAQFTKLGGALTVGIWNNYLSGGIGYLNGKALLLVNIGISL